MSGDSKLAFPTISADPKTHSLAQLGGSGGGENRGGSSQAAAEISKIPIHIVNASTTPLRKSSLDLLDTSTVYPEYVRSIKEKECWLLYQKMVKKGISVSYETILRGILTPSEVRAVEKKQREITERQASIDAEMVVGLSATNSATDHIKTITVECDEQSIK